MGQIIKTFSDGSFLEYDQGSFDSWCVYLTRKGGIRKPPRDTDYFTQLKQLANKYGTDRVYKDYCCIYDLTGKNPDASVLSKITEIANQYSGDVLDIDIMFSILYMAMISEEQKKGTRLGKRIKRLGVYELLVKNRSVFDAANFMRGMKWQEIDALCKNAGF